MVEEYSPAEFVRKRESDDRWQLLDVREQWEIDLASVPGCVQIPMADVPERMPELNRSCPVGVICHSGVRSMRVSEYLVAQGFSPVANIAGGIDAWAASLDDKMARY